VKDHIPHIVITLSAVAFLAGHIFFPAFKVDSITLFLLAFAIVPWLGMIFKSLELPGGLKFEYQEFKQAARAAAEAGLLNEAEPESQDLRQPEVPTYVSIMDDDPNLSLAGLRIDLEQRLQKLAQANHIESSRKGLGQLLRELETHQVLSSRQTSALRDISRSLNLAAHGEDITMRDARDVMKIGRQLIYSLDKRFGIE
jgi:hypothetical protein